MDDRIITMYLSRILSGYYVFVLDRKRYKIKYPDTNLKYEAEVYAQEEYDKNKYESWIQKDQLKRFMMFHGLWSNEEEEFLETADKTTDDLKVSIYKNFRNPPALKKFKENLTSHTKKVNRLQIKKSSFDYITLEGYCDYVKSNFLLSRSIYDEFGNLCFLEDDNGFESVAAHITRNIINSETFRIVARSPQWSYYWNSKKVGDLFDAPIINWTDEQRILAAISRMYDGAREHMEGPDDDVFEDDDAFDGWCISERRKQEEERSKSRAEKMLPGNLKNANEVFVMVDNQYEAKDVYSLNDSGSKSIIKERNQILQNQKEIKEQHLPDVQRDIIISQNQKMIQSRKNK